MEKNLKKNIYIYMYTYITKSLCCIHLKLTQYYITQLYLKIFLNVLIIIPRN